MRILYLDDNYDDHVLMYEVFKDQLDTNLHCIFTTNEAIEQLRYREYDFIFMDYYLAVAADILAPLIRKFCQTPLYLVTSMSKESLNGRIKFFDGVIYKAKSFVEFQKNVRETINDRRQSTV